jgi:hypothetical protein
MSNLRPDLLEGDFLLISLEFVQMANLLCRGQWKRTLHTLESKSKIPVSVVRAWTA